MGKRRDRKRIRRDNPDQRSTVKNHAFSSELRVRLFGRVLVSRLEDGVRHLFETGEFSSWIRSVGDTIARAKINRHVGKLRRGLYGDSKGVGDGVCEMRIDIGPGYRVYYSEWQEYVILLLVGGDKGSQSSDIAEAKRLWKEIQDGQIEQL